MSRRLLTLLFVAFIGCARTATEVDRPQIPDLSGRYAASIEAGEFRRVKAPSRFGGRWTLDVGPEEYTVEGAFRITEFIDVTDEDTLVVHDVPAPAGAFNCYDASGTRLVPPDEVEATYSFEIDNEGLRLAAEDEPCPYRQTLLERTWRSVR